MVERLDRHRRGVRRRRLGVVEPAHAVGVADELDAVRRSDERAERGRDRVGGPARPASSARAAAARPFVTSCGQRAAHRGDRGERPGRPGQHGVRPRPGDVVVGAARGERPVARRRRRQVAHHDRVVGEADGGVGRSLLGEDACLGRLVARHAGVPVEVVGREVQPHRGVGRGTARSTPAGSSCTRRRTRRRRGRGRRRVACRCCRRRPPGRRPPPASRRSAASSSSCRPCR